MTDSTPSALIERLERLERDNRRMKRGGAALLLALAALFVMGHGEPAVKRIEGDQIALRAPGGRIRGELSLQGDGGARFILYDTGRTPRLELLSAPPNGRPALTLYDDRWAPRATLRLDDDGTPQLALYDRAGKVLWSAP
jgi:hypothetical protein